MRSSIRVFARKRASGMMDCRGWGLHRIVGRASHAILVESCLRWDYGLIKSHYIRPISSGSGLVK